MELKTCPKCHKQSAPSRTICRHCKSPLTSHENDQDGRPEPQEKEKSNTKNCPTCNDVVSKSAKSCPHCGHTFTSRTTKGCLWIILLVATIAFYGTNSRTPSNTNAQPQVTKEPAIKDDGKQPQRRAFIRKLIDNGVIYKIEKPGEIPRIYVGPTFILLPYDTKNNFLDAILTYYIIENPESNILIIKDELTGKSIGTFSDRGLDMDD